jgi:hypothetical protein
VSRSSSRPSALTACSRRGSPKITRHPAHAVAQPPRPYDARQGGGGHRNKGNVPADEPGSLAQDASCLRQPTSECVFAMAEQRRRQPTRPATAARSPTSRSRALRHAGRFDRARQCAGLRAYYRRHALENIAGRWQRQGGSRGARACRDQPIPILAVLSFLHVAAARRALARSLRDQRLPRETLAETAQADD